MSALLSGKSQTRGLSMAHSTQTCVRGKGWPVLLVTAASMRPAGAVVRLLTIFPPPWAAALEAWPRGNAFMCPDQVSTSTIVTPPRGFPILRWSYRPVSADCSGNSLSAGELPLPAGNAFATVAAPATITVGPLVWTDDATILVELIVDGNPDRGIFAGFDEITMSGSPFSYTIGGTVSGLAANRQVTLRNQRNAETLTLTSNGSFSFVSSQLNGTNFDTAILTQPIGQLCILTGNRGVIESANVTSLSVVCSSRPLRVGGTIAGLNAGQTVVLRNTSTGEDLARSANGAFEFNTIQFTGQSYAAVIQTQPVGQTCVISNANGTLLGNNAESISVVCTDVTYSIGGSVGGLSPGASVVIRNAGTGDSLTVNANGSFVFPTPQAVGTSYTIAVLGQPIGQICSVLNATGSVSTGNVSNVVVSCLSLPELIFNSGFE
jgi:hypothetical protein